MLEVLKDVGVKQLLSVVIDIVLNRMEYFFSPLCTENEGYTILSLT